MAHETHEHHSTENKPKTALNSSFWFVVILAGLFIAAVNFINVMSHDEGGHGADHESGETHAPAAHEGHETAGEEHHAAGDTQHAADTTHEAVAEQHDSAAHKEEAHH